MTLYSLDKTLKIYNIQGHPRSSSRS